MTTGVALRILRWLWPLLLIPLALLPILLFPLWWQIPTSADPDGTLRALHGSHIEWLTDLQMLGFASVLLLIPAFVHLVAAVIYKLIGKPIENYWIRSCMVILVLCPTYFSIPMFIRIIEYPGLEKNSEAITADLESIYNALHEWKRQHGEFPERMLELRTSFATLPTRPSIAKLPDYGFKVHPRESSVVFVYMSGYLWWDSNEPFVYCPDDDCQQFARNPHEPVKQFGSLIYKRIGDLKLPTQ